jgi:uncharacterized protein
MTTQAQPQLQGAPPPPLQFTLKVASRCNLNCSYCYVYNKGDDSWRSRPGLMPETVFRATVERIREHALAAHQSEIEIVFHGGEPCLLGVERFSRWCGHLRDRLRTVGEVKLTMQSNAVLIDRVWARALADLRVEVGVSVDGPRAIHDRERVDKRGRGSHAAVVAGIGRLRDHGLPVNLLCVIALGQDPIAVHEHLLGLGASSISYLMPDHTPRTVLAARREFGRTPCADFLVPIMDHWLEQGHRDVSLQPFKSMARIILGGVARVDFLGNNPYRFVFIEADGAIEGLDVLRICEPGLAATSLNVFDNPFAELLDGNPLHRELILSGFTLPTDCKTCPEATTCGGGYVPHRYADGHFDHPSAWCADLLAMFEHMRMKLEVSAEETHLRREVLAGMREEAIAQCA